MSALTVSILRVASIRSLKDLLYSFITPYASQSLTCAVAQCFKTVVRSFNSYSLPHRTCSQKVATSKARKPTVVKPKSGNIEIAIEETCLSTVSRLTPKRESE